jgi:hypothetical protein
VVIGRLMLFFPYKFSSNMAFTIDDKMTWIFKISYKNVIIKILYNDSKMTINISSHIKNYDM